MWGVFPFLFVICCVLHHRGRVCGKVRIRVVYIYVYIYTTLTWRSVLYAVNNSNVIVTGLLTTCFVALVK